MPRPNTWGAPGPQGNFGTRIDPIDGTKKFHTGIDLKGPEGIPILSAADGVVRRAGTRGGYGNSIEIDHGNGVSTLYGHASVLNVKPGEEVHRGEEIGEVGHTGRATGPHLHFEVRVEGKPVDPSQPLRRTGFVPTTRSGEARKPAFNTYENRRHETSD